MNGLSLKKDLKGMKVQNSEKNKARRRRRRASNGLGLRVRTALTE